MTPNVKATLYDELESLFGEFAHPGDKALASSLPNEWESIFEQLHGKNWHTVEISDFDSQGGIYEGIQVLSVRGFVYFLPGLVRIALTQPRSEPVISALLSQFAHLDRPGSSFQKQQKIIASLSPEQRNFLARFFAEMQRLDPLICSAISDSAIRNLAEGRITSYQQSDVEQWLSKLA